VLAEPTPGVTSHATAAAAVAPTAIRVSLICLAHPFVGNTTAAAAWGARGRGFHELTAAEPRADRNNRRWPDSVGHVTTG